MSDNNTGRPLWRKNAIFFLVALTSLFGFVQSAFLSSPAQAAIPQTVGYQGRLKNASGTALTGTFTFIFRIYASSTGGVPLYAETQSGVTVDQGSFAVQLGSVTPFPASLDFNQPLFLTTEVNGDGEMAPRVAINTVPYAYTTGGVNALASAPVSGTGGRMYYDTSSGTLNYFNTLTSSWVQLRSSASAVTDAEVVNGLTIDATGNINASAINSGTLGNGGVTLAIGNFGAITGTLTDANVSDILTVNGGLINNTPIGASIPSTGVFTDTTSTNATVTGLFATNATIQNLTLTGAAPSEFSNIIWTNATGTYTTTTNLFANAAVFGSVTTTNFRADGSTDIQNLNFLNATGSNLVTFGVVSSTFLHAQESTIGVATASVMNVDTVLHVGLGNFPVIGNSVAQFGGMTNTFLQVNSQNHSAGDNASTDYVATNDIGDDSSFYIDLGINSSGYNNPAFSITGPNDGYLYAQSSDLVMGSAAATGTIKFHTGGTTAADEVMRITSGHQVGIGTTNPSSTLDVLGDGRFSGNLTAGGLTDLNSLAWIDANGGNTTSTNLAVTSYVRLPTDTRINGTSVCLFDGTDCPSGTTPSFQTVTNTGNTTTNDIQFNGGTSTGDFRPSVDAVLSLGSSALRWNGNFGSVTSAEATVTDLSATNGTVTNLLFTNGTSTSWLGFNAASGSALTAGIVDASSLAADTATVTDLVATNSTSTNIFAVNGIFTNGTLTNGTVTNLLFTNGTSTSWLGFATASGTAINALTGTFNILNSTNVALTGGTIDGVRIGSTTPSTAVFTDATTTNATTTNFFATNATIANLTVTGSSPSSFANFVWTNATGTNTTSTNLFATFATLSNAVIASSTINIPSLGGTTFTQSDVNNDVTFPGWVTGGDITITGPGTFDVSGGVGYLRAVNSHNAPIYRVTWPALTGNTIATNTIGFVYVAYNGGSPQIVVSASPPPNEQQNITLANVTRGVGHADVQRPSSVGGFRFIDP